MIVKKYHFRTRTHRDRVGTFAQDTIGWYLFGLIPLYVKDL